MTAAAAQTETPDLGQLSYVSSQFASLLQLALILAAVLALAYVVLRVLLPKFFGVSPAASGPIEILSRHVLEPKKSLYIVKVGGEMFLIASSESNIQFLTALNAGDLGPQIERYRTAGGSPGDFSGILKGLQRFQKPKAVRGGKP